MEHQHTKESKKEQINKEDAQSHHEHHKGVSDHEHHEHKNGNGHHDHHKMMIGDFKRRFWVSLIVSIPVLALSPMIQNFFGFDSQFIGSTYLIFGLSSFIFFYGGRPFLTGLKDELKEGSPGMMALIAVAITVAYIYSSAVVFGLEGKMFFWELVTLVDIMLLGHWIEMKSVLGASKSLELLVAMIPSEAHKVDGDVVRDVKLEEIKKNDILLVKPSEKVPTDGIIVEGESYLNESMLTGESKPVKRVKNDKVIGGALNGKSTIKVRVQHTGKDSYLNTVIAMVQEAQKVKSKTQHLADKAAKWLTYIALLAGLITLSTWLILGYEFDYALERMVTVMVISCPHALGLAIPLVVAISTSISAQNGLLIRNRTAFENSRKISTIVFDKTGTLTKGDFEVSRFESFSDKYDKNEILRLASALENNSEHPIAVGIVKKIKELKKKIPHAENFNSITGKGVEAKVEGKEAKIVSPGYLKEKSIEVPENTIQNKAETVVFVILNNELSGFIVLSDTIRHESKEAIKKFKANNIKVMMATGDNKEVAKAVSDILGLDGYYAEVLPDRKVDVIKELQDQGEFVAMTGDGVNDAPALAQADVGIAVGSGTDVAAETADIILVKSNPNDILNLILFGKATYNKMIQNLVWATAYNALAIPLAAGLLTGYGFVLSPAMGAVFMSLSTVIVAINAQLLKNKMHT